MLARRHTSHTPRYSQYTYTQTHIYAPLHRNARQTLGETRQAVMVRVQMGDTSQAVMVRVQISWRAFL